MDTASMAKSIRSKIKKKNRSYMRATVGEKVRVAQIAAVTQRLEQKKAGMANTRTLIAMKNALGIDLGKAYYDAVVKPQQAPDAADQERGEEEEVVEQEKEEAMDEDAASASEDEDEKQAREAEFSEIHAAPGRKGQVNKRRRPKPQKRSGSGMFSKRTNARSSRPPKVMVKF